MNDFIHWLIGIEERAATLYAKAAAAFSEDIEFSRFLSQMAQEEQAHIALLRRAIGPMSQKTMTEACFFLDEDLRRKIEDPFTRAQLLLQEGKLSKTTMIDVIAEAEFSEWNEIFLYTVDTLKFMDEDFQKAVSEVDKHRMNIQNFISSIPGGDSLLQRIRRLCPVWNKRVLIVEDNLAIARMLKALIMEEAEVILACDGEEGLAYIQEGHFDLIITDVEIPKINGLEMYKQAVGINPALKSRFIFFTGTEKPEYLSFFKSSNVIVLPKPSPVKLICKVINEVTGTTPCRQNSSLH